MNAQNLKILRAYVKCFDYMQFNKAKNLLESYSKLDQIAYFKQMKAYIKKYKEMEKLMESGNDVIIPPSNKVAKKPKN